MPTAATEQHPTDDYRQLDESAAEVGCVFGPGGTLMSEAERWFEDGMHVIRSLEFDLIAEDPDSTRVVDVFIENLFDLGASLAELHEQDRATEGERDLLAKLSQRFFKAAQAVEREERRRRVLIRLRARGHGSGRWRRQTRRPNSTSPSYA